MTDATAYSAIRWQDTQPAAVPKLCGADIELGNSLLGLEYACNT